MNGATDPAQSCSPERLCTNLASVRARLHAACMRVQRAPGDVRMIAVTKYVSQEQIRQLIAFGVHDLAENRLQVAREKIPAFSSYPELRWHMIGHLQTNKVKQALPLFSQLDSVDSLHLLEAIDKAAAQSGLSSVPCLLQVNISGEQQKYGLHPEAVRAFLNEASNFKHARFVGFMCMAPYSEDLEILVRPVFRAIKALQDEANRSNWYRSELQTLSMGMSHDFEVAIEEGATEVRIGSALFAFD